MSQSIQEQKYHIHFKHVFSIYINENDELNEGREEAWSSEEDKVHLRHVSKYGPREWSSIRSKGLLPRTGKSCRLRWVNKLRSNFKTGCKFTAEEERLVIELQAQYGNKWAKIATYLQGRTDNDVKNFWSSRRKRLERMLQKPPASKPQKNKGKVHLNQVQQMEEMVPPCSSNQVEEILSYATSYMGNTLVFEMTNLQDLIKPNYQQLENDYLSAVEVDATHFTQYHRLSLHHQGTTSLYSLNLNHSWTFHCFPECQDLVPEPFDPNFVDGLEDKKCLECVCSSSQKLGTWLPTFGLEGNSQSASPNGFFKDFPGEIFEYFKHIPTSSDQ